MFVYKNITKSLQTLTLVSAQRNSVTHVHIGPGSTIDLNYPGLDQYMPHILARLDEGGNDITHKILRKNAETPKVVAPAKPRPLPPQNQVLTSEVAPGRYVDKTPTAQPSLQKAVAKVAAKATEPAPLKDATPLEETTK
jgi:hypothetical protein